MQMVRKGSEAGMIMIDIDMPDNCDECRFNTEYGFCKAMPDNFCGNTDDRKKPEWCPMKGQEPKPVGKEWNECPSCGKTLDRIHDMHYCGVCGQAVKWDG